jgi:hypothetical protein
VKQYCRHNRSTESLSSSRGHLWHTNREVFQIIGKEKKPVLVTKDDVQFTRYFRENAKGVEEFVMARSNTPLLYFLGCLPFAVSPRIWSNHFRILGFCNCSHAVMMTATVREMLKTRIVNTVHDRYMSWHFPSFAHRKCLAFQNHPRTVNMSTYDPHGVMWFLSKMVGSDRNGEPLYSAFHWTHCELVPRLLGILVVVLTFSSNVFGFCSQVRRHSLDTRKTKTHTHTHTEPRGWRHLAGCFVI